MVFSTWRAAAAGLAILVIAGCAHSHGKPEIDQSNPTCVYGSDKDAEFKIRFAADGTARYEPKLDNTTYNGVCRVKSNKKITFVSEADPGATARAFEVWFLDGKTPSREGVLAKVAQQNQQGTGPFMVTFDGLKSRQGRREKVDDRLNIYRFEIRLGTTVIDPSIIIDE